MESLCMFSQVTDLQSFRCSTLKSLLNHPKCCRHVRQIQDRKSWSLFIWAVYFDVQEFTFRASSWVIFIKRKWLQKSTGFQRLQAVFAWLALDEVQLTSEYLTTAHQVQHTTTNSRTHHVLLSTIWFTAVILTCEWMSLTRFLWWEIF